MGFWESKIAEMRNPQQLLPAPTIPQRPPQQDDPENLDFDITDPQYARRPVVGSDVITVTNSPRSWDANSRPVEQTNQFDMSLKDRRALNRKIAAGQYNTDGTDVAAAKANAATIQEAQRAGAWSDVPQQPTRFA